MISRLRRLISPEPEVHVTARQVEGAPWPEETRITADLRDVRFEPETLSVEFEAITAERVDFSALRLQLFTKQAFLLEMSDSDEVGERVLELLG